MTALACGALAAPAWSATAGSSPAASGRPAAAAHPDTMRQALRQAAVSAHGVDAGAAARTSSAAAPTVVVSGLDNPRQIALVSHQDVLLVAEAGHGGSQCAGEGENETCVGATGSISAVLGPQRAIGTRPLRILRGFLSGAGPDGSFAVGPDGVGATTLNRIFVQETWAPPDVIPQGLPGRQSGKLLFAAPFTRPHVTADITAFEAAHDPDNQGFDSNPYAVLVRRDRIFVADAAGNDILVYNRHNGRLSLFAVLPNIQTGACAGQPNDNGTTGCDPVPNSLAVASNGDILVGGLGGEAPGAGRVWQLDSRTGHIVRTWAGLTTVTGVASDRRGNVYASELLGEGASPDLPGRLVKISRNGHRSSVPVPLPAGVAVDRWGHVFVAAFSVAPASGLGAPGTSGQIWRLRL